MPDNGEWFLIADPASLCEAGRGDPRRVTRCDHQAHRFTRRMNLWRWTGPRQHDLRLDGEVGGGRWVMRKPIDGD